MIKQLTYMMLLHELYKQATKNNRKGEVLDMARKLLPEYADMMDKTLKDVCVRSEAYLNKNNIPTEFAHDIVKDITHRSWNGFFAV